MIIYLAGAESWNKQFSAAGIQNRLFSYYYLRKKREKEWLKLLADLEADREVFAKQGKKLRLFLDSGAFTYRMDRGSVAPEAYVRDYCTFLRETRGLWTCAAEFDAEEFEWHGEPVGMAKVDAYRELIQEAAGGFFPILPVWHPIRGQAAWDSYCADPRFPYLGVGSGSGANVGVNNRLCAKARMAGKVVHLFAETKIMTDMKYLKADSVDSSTWLRATKYGGLFLFHANQFRILDHKHKHERTLYRSYFKKNGIDWTKFKDEEAEKTPEGQAELTKCSLIAWRNLAARYEVMSGTARARMEAVEARYAQPVAQEPRSGMRQPVALNAAGDNTGGLKMAPKPKVKIVPKKRSHAPKPPVEDADAEAQRECPEDGQTTPPTSTTTRGHKLLPLAYGRNWLGTRQAQRDALAALEHAGVSVEIAAATLGLKIPPDASGQAGEDRKPATDDAPRERETGEPKNPGAGVIDASPRGTPAVQVRERCDGCGGACFRESDGAACVVCGGSGVIVHEITARVEQVYARGNSGDMEPVAREGAAEVNDICDRCKATTNYPPRTQGKPLFCPDCQLHIDALLANPRQRCGTCQGRGEIPDDGDHDERCPDCQGKGWRAAQVTGGIATEEDPGGIDIPIPVPHTDTQGLPLHQDHGSLPGLPRSRAVPSRDAVNPSTSVKEPVRSGKLAVLTDTAVKATVDAPDEIELFSTAEALSCSKCALGDTCKHFEEGSDCYYDKAIKALPVRDIGKQIDYVGSLLQWDGERTFRALMAERLSTGGQIDPRVSGQLDDHLRRLEDFHRLQKMQGGAAVRAHVSVSGPATAQAGGILASIFGAGKRPDDSGSIELNPEGGGSVEVTVEATRPKEG